MSALGAEGAAMGFLPAAEHGFALSAAPSPLREEEEVLDDDPKLPPLRMPTSFAAFPGSSSGSDSDSFLSMSSTPSGKFCFINACEQYKISSRERKRVPGAV